MLINNRTECSTNFDLYQAELENKFLEMLEREKHNILVRNAVQIAQLEVLNYFLQKAQ